MHYPVYFAFEDEKIDAILADVKRKDAIADLLIIINLHSACLSLLIIINLKETEKVITRPKSMDFKQT
ncbi:hypothetical protein FRX31_015020, partial [Thalictrum thalictroides]